MLLALILLPFLPILIPLVSIAALGMMGTAAILLVGAAILLGPPAVGVHLLDAFALPGAAESPFAWCFAILLYWGLLIVLSLRSS